MKSSALAIIENAKIVLEKNQKSGYSEWAKTSYQYTCPSAEHYKHQWFWDSCFISIVYSHFDIYKAKNEIDSLLFSQRKNGFIPHIIFWDKKNYNSFLTNFGAKLESKLDSSARTTELIQPPLIAEAVYSVYKKEKDITYLKRVVPLLLKYYLWLAKNRDPDGDGLISIIAPYESGLDQSPSFDSALGSDGKSQLKSALLGRMVTFKNLYKNYDLSSIFDADYFNVEDILVNSIYLKNLQVLSKLCHEIDDETNSIKIHHFYKKGLISLLHKCFNKQDNFFYDLSGKKEDQLKIKTIKGLFPLILDIPQAIVEKLVKNFLKNENEFLTPFSVPTVSLSEPTFTPQPEKFLGEPVIWRGPSWVNTNWYIASGLSKHGYQKESDKITEDTLNMIEKSGFREFFNPFSGEGYGAHNFSWSTLVVDMLLS